MNKSFKYLGINWVISFIVFNAVTFLVPRYFLGFDRFGKGSFWIAYAMIMIAFIGQLAVSYVFGKKTKLDDMFLGLPLVGTAHTAVIVTLIVGSVSLLLPAFIPPWIGGIVCVVVLAIFAAAGLKASTAAEAVAETGAKIKAQTSFIKLATVDAETIVASATDLATRAAATKVYEAIRYSDPMSVPALAGVEGQIGEKLIALKSVVKGAEGDATALADEIVLLIKERNAKCMALK